MKKTISLVLLGILAIAVGVAIYLYMSFESLVKSGVETYGPQYTQTDVSIGGINASIFGGEVTIKDFRVGNPEGFSTPHAISIGSFRVAVDTDSIGSDEIHIREITIDSPDLIYEMMGGSSNLQKIQKNIEAAAGGSGPANESKPAADKGEGPQVVIDNVYIRNVKAAVSADFLGGKLVPLPVSDLHLKDIGKGGEDASMADAMSQIMDQLTGSVLNAVGNVDLKGMAEGAGKMLEDAGKGAGGAVDGAKKQLEGLFGK